MNPKISFIILVYNGGEYLELDEYTKDSWALRSHYYMNFYLFSYAISMAVASSIATKILNGDTNTVLNTIKRIESTFKRAIESSILNIGKKHPIIITHVSLTF